MASQRPREFLVRCSKGAMARTLIVAAATLLVLCEGLPIREKIFKGEKTVRKDNTNPGFDYLHLVQASTSKEDC